MDKSGRQPPQGNTNNGSSGVNKAKVSGGNKSNGQTGKVQSTSSKVSASTTYTTNVSSTGSPLGNASTATKSKNTNSKDTNVSTSSISSGANSTSKKSSGKKKGSKKQPEASTVLLGLPDEPMAPEDDLDPYTAKLGGVPNWLDENQPAPSRLSFCGSCGRKLFLLMQAYVPLEKSPFDRVVYVWACNRRLCMRKPGSFRIIRALKKNPEFAQKLEKKKITATPTSALSSTLLTVTPAPGSSSNPFGALGTTVSTAANPFAMGNTLFGGSGSGFSNPFATPSSTSTPTSGLFGGSTTTASFTNPFGSIPSVEPVSTSSTGVSSYSSAAAQSIEKDDIRGVEEMQSKGQASETVEPVDVAKELEEWSKDVAAFSPHYLYITNEVFENSESDDDLATRYSQYMSLEDQGGDSDAEDSGATNGATWGGEAYEKATLPKGMDKAFQIFVDRVQSSWASQCVRYEFPGVPLLFSFSDHVAKQLLPPNEKQHSKHTQPSAHRVPKCPVCQGPRAYEMQLMPNTLQLLNVTAKEWLSEEEKTGLKNRKGADVFNVGMEWGTVLIYSCQADCAGSLEDGQSAGKVGYFEEIALVQYED